MKQRYALTVADTEINVITDEPREAIDTVVGVVDRGIREIHLKSRNCSRNEASLLLCLEYCAEKLKLQKKIKLADAEINRLAALNDAAARENAALVREVEALRKNLNMKSITPAPTTRITPAVQLSIAEDLKDEERYVPAKEEPLQVKEETARPIDEILSNPEEPEEIEEIEEIEETVENTVEEVVEEAIEEVVEEAVEETVEAAESDLNSFSGIHIVEETVEEAPATPVPTPEEPPKKKRGRNMFDLITFDKL